eukprot:284937_1
MMRYQDIFSEQYLNHIYEYQHPEIDCKFGDKCFAFNRLIKGGNELKDRCHIAIYKHPPRRRDTINLGEKINSFVLNDEWYENKPLYYPTDEDEKECKYNQVHGFLQLLVEEVVDNKFEADLCLTDDNINNHQYTIMTIVDNKINCTRHKLMGSPLNRAEMLSIILYTGGECNYDLCKSQGVGDYVKWKWFDYLLFNAIRNLSLRE